MARGERGGARWRRALIVGVVGVAVFGFAEGRAAAAEIEPPFALPPVEVHGFVSPGFIFSTSNNYLAKSTHGSFELTEVGLNFTSALTEKLRTGIQLFTRQVGTTGNYNAKVDWFYLDYHFDDAIGLRAGRVKIPFGLYNDTSDIDMARVPVLLPQSIYSVQSRDFLLAQTGTELYGRANLKSLGALEYRMYAGTIFLDPAAQTSVTAQVEQIDVPYVVGERLMWETPVDGLRIGGTMQTLRLDATFRYQNSDVALRLPVVISVGSVEYNANDLLLAAEYSRQYVRLRGSDTTLIPPTEAVSERMYGMTSYRVSKWFQPGLYYSLFYPNIHQRSGPAAMQHDVAATVRVDINSHWLFKVEGHFMSGTAGLSSLLNDNKPLDQLERNWGVFLVKTTAYF